MPLRGTYSFRSMLIDGKKENGKPKVLAASKPFLFGMDVVVSSDTKIDPCEDSVDKNVIGGSTAFCSKLRRNGGKYVSRYFQDASPRICLGPIDINSELLEGIQRLIPVRTLWIKT